MERNNWISIYFFYEGVLDNILLQLVKPVLQEVLSKYVDQYFFIKYYEDGPHIRLRLKGNVEVLENFVKPKIERLSEEFFLIESTSFKGFIKYEPYLPEVERYGGKFGVDHAEKLFQLSSDLVLKLVDNSAWNYQKALGYTLQVHLIFVYTFFKDLKEADLFIEFGQNCWTYNLLKKYKGDNINDQDINQVKTEMVNLHKKQEDNINGILDDTYKKLKDKKSLKNPALQKWKIGIEKSYKNFHFKEVEISSPPNKIDDLKSSLYQKWIIIDSYIHMTNNRLGINNKDEAYIYYILKMFITTISVKQETLQVIE